MIYEILRVASVLSWFADRKRDVSRFGSDLLRNQESHPGGIGRGQFRRRGDRVYREGVFAGPRQAESKVIRRPFDEDFAYLNNLVKEHEWQPHLQEGSPVLASDQSSVGCQHCSVNQYMCRIFPSEHVVTA